MERKKRVVELQNCSMCRGRRTSNMRRACVGARELCAASAVHGLKLSMGCLKLLEERAARSTSGRRRKGYAFSLALSSMCRGRRTSNMRRACVGEREAVAEYAKHGPRLSMGCLKLLEECAARSTSGRRRKGYAFSLALSSIYRELQTSNSKSISKKVLFEQCPFLSFTNINLLYGGSLSIHIYICTSASY